MFPPILAPATLPPSFLSLTRFLRRVRRVVRAAQLDMQLTGLRKGLPSLRPCLGHLEAVPRLGVGFRRVLELLVGVEEGEALEGLLFGFGCGRGSGEGGREGGKGVLLLARLAYLVRLFHVGLAPAPLVAHRGGRGGRCVGLCVEGVGLGGSAGR